MYARPTGYSVRELEPEVQAWIARGAVVDSITRRAVSNAIKYARAQGLIWNSVSGVGMIRLNLFCGADLTTCLMPVLCANWGGPTSDTNNNFVAADYIERGINGGLIGNGTNKWLDTGLNGDQFTAQFSGAGTILTGPVTHPGTGVVWTTQGIALNSAHFNNLRQINGSIDWLWDTGAVVTVASPNNPYASAQLLKPGIYQTQGRVDNVPVAWFNGLPINGNPRLATNIEPTWPQNSWGIFAKNASSGVQDYCPFRLGGYYMWKGAATNDHMVAMNTMLSDFSLAMGRRIA